MTESVVLLSVVLMLLGPLTPLEMTFLLLLGAILFGRRLPDVGRSLGKGWMEFREGARDFWDREDNSVEGPSAYGAPLYWLLLVVYLFALFVALLALKMNAGS